MYPLRINLLTEDKKDRLVHMAQFKFIQNILQVIFLAISFVAISLLFSEVLLQNYYSAIAQNTINISSKYTSKSREIADINKLIKRVNTAQQKYYKITPTIMDMASSEPEGITLNSLNISYSKKTVALSGTASTREAFLNFQEILNNNPLFVHVESPVSDLTKKENISFNISANLK